MEEALTSDLDRDFHVHGRTWWLVSGRTWWLGWLGRNTPTAGPITLRPHWRRAKGLDVNRDFHICGRTWWLEGTSLGRHTQRFPAAPKSKHFSFIGGRHGLVMSTGTSTSSGGLGGLGGIGRHTHNGSNHLPVQFFFAPVGQSLPVGLKGVPSTCSTSLSSLT
jgi:hypothetical protein